MENTTPDISNYKKCIEDSTRAIIDHDFGPEDSTNYYQLKTRLEASKGKLPPLYHEIFFQPFVNKIDKIGETGFNNILMADPAKEGDGGMMMYIAQASIQNGEGYNWVSTDAFE